MPRRTILAAVLALLAASPAAAQKATQGQVAYVEGVRAFDAGDYATAAARMRAALAEDPVEAPSRFRYRAQNREDYFPHLWLGLSLERLGDRDGALAALRESQGQGAVDARPALRRILSAALARLTPPTPSPEPEPEPEPEPTPTTPSPVLVLPVPDAAPAQKTTVLPTPAATPALARSEARRPASPATPTVPAAAGSGAAVRAGLRAFFRGDYEGAGRLLSPEAGRSPVARVFLAWSLGGRYLLTEPRDEALLSRARAEYSAALLAGAPTQGEPWVSPAILALFGAEADAPAGAAP
jgi:tetratricopeptide (TPR) repeat protein